MLLCTIATHNLLSYYCGGVWLVHRASTAKSNPPKNLIKEVAQLGVKKRILKESCGLPTAKFFSNKTKPICM